MKFKKLLSNIFISPKERRLRAGWRLLVQTIMMLIIGLGLGFLFILLSGPIQQLHIGSFLSQISELIIITGSVYLARRFIDRRSFVSLGLKWNRRASTDIFVGIAIAGLMMGLIYLLEWGFGWLEFQTFAWQVEPISSVLKNALSMLIVFILVGWNEELLSRGYHLQTLASGINLTWGIIISSAVFGIMHLSNPNATWISAAGIFLSGIFLAYGYIRSGQLWLSIGLH
ncbi:MAG: type II CAAX endopeptidase family protein, partial [Chloroflexota bacterium]|nr:type II CAAX endopeptidase family protein [Chloroflexota bacterium]